MSLAMNHQPARPPATYQDVIDAPADKVAEIVAGTLYLHPRPRFRHSHAIGAVGYEVYGAFHKGRGGPGGWWILIEPEVHLGDDVFVPDVVGWRRERMPEFPADAPFGTLVPDWICEVLSPSTRTFDLTTKRTAYAAHGVEHLWLVDPEARTLEAFRLAAGAWTLAAALAGDAEASVPPFDAIAFPLADLWAE
jgi:Uma2 family endonuclease